MTTEPVGFVASSTIVSDCVDVTLPTPSTNSASNVFVPSPEGSVVLTELAYATHEPQDAPALRTRICVTPVYASVADRLTVTLRVVVYPAPAAIETVALGGSTSTVCVRLSVVAANVSPKHDE